MWHILAVALVVADPFLERAALIDGVAEIAAPGVPGGIVAIGDGAFPVIAGRSGQTPVVTVAAAEHRQRGRGGRMVAFSHGGYGDAGTLAQADTETFMRNSVRWSAGDRRARRDRPVRVGLLRAEGVRSALGSGFELTTLGGDWLEALGELDVVVSFQADLDDRQVQGLVRFIERGGGLVAGMTPWGWVQVNRGADPTANLDSNGLNQVAHALGLAWTEDYVSRTGEVGFLVEETLPEALHGGRALAMLVGDADGTAPLDEATRTLASEAALKAVRALPESARSIRQRLDLLLSNRGFEDVPAPDRPLGRDRALARVLLAHEMRLLETLPPQRVRAHPSAAAFPGEVPRDARRMRTTVPIDLARWGWHGTGLYAVAGEVVTIDVPEALVGAGAAVRIGCHTDALWHHDRWQRVPEIAGHWPLKAPRTTVASAFGGLVYIDVPNGRSGTVEVRIGGGVVEAPRFVRGRTTAAEWSRARRAPGPWAELESDKVVISVPSEAVRELEDPEALMELWDRILDTAADLAVIPHERSRPERYVPDVQISVGYMHAGYPIMTHLDAVDDMVSVDNLLRGSWGLYHELGHNHQDSMWTFDGTIEVTVNLFSLYIGQNVCGHGPREGHPALEQRERMMRAFFHDRRGPSWERWANDPFLALIMYQQVQEEFGWDAYKRIFAEYQRIPQRERPRTQQEKRDQWMVRLSRTVGHDLGPFFDAWHVPVTDEAKAQVADLPEWMPAELVEAIGAR